MICSSCARLGLCACPHEARVGVLDVGPALRRAGVRSWSWTTVGSAVVLCVIVVLLIVGGSR